MGGQCICCINIVALAYMPTDVLEMVKSLGCFENLYPRDLTIHVLPVLYLLYVVYTLISKFKKLK